MYSESKKVMTFSEFKKLVEISMEDICLEIFKSRNLTIKIKKEKVAIKNLVTIFDATLTLSNKKGFPAMSLRDLCQESGLSMGALYSYFSSKDELLQNILDQGRKTTIEILLNQIQDETDPLEKLKKAITSHLYLTEIMQKWFYFAYMETRFFNQSEFKKAMQSELFTEEILTRILSEGQQQGVFKSKDPSLTAAVIKAMLQDWYLKKWKYVKRKITVEQYAQFIIEFIETFIVKPLPDKNANEP